MDALARPHFSSSSLLLSSLELSDTHVYEPLIRARLGTAAHLCEVVVLKLRTGWLTILKLASLVCGAYPATLERPVNFGAEKSPGMRVVHLGRKWPGGLVEGICCPLRAHQFREPK